MATKDCFRSRRRRSLRPLRPVDKRGRYKRSITRRRCINPSGDDLCARRRGCRAIVEAGAKGNDSRGRGGRMKKHATRHRRQFRISKYPANTMGQAWITMERGVTDVGVENGMV